MLYSHGVAWFVARNGSRFVHASNVFIARRLYCRIVSSGRDDIYSEPPKNWTKMGANFWPVPTPWFLFYRPLWGNEIQRCLKQRQVFDKSWDFFRKSYLLHVLRKKEANQFLNGHYSKVSRLGHMRAWGRDQILLCPNCSPANFLSLCLWGMRT